MARRWTSTWSSPRATRWVGGWVSEVGGLACCRERFGAHRSWADAPPCVPSCAQLAHSCWAHGVCAAIVSLCTPLPPTHPSTHPPFFLSSPFFPAGLRRRDRQLAHSGAVLQRDGVKLPLHPPHCAAARALRPGGQQRPRAGARHGEGWAGARGRQGCGAPRLRGDGLRSCVFAPPAPLHPYPF